MASPEAEITKLEQDVEDLKERAEREPEKAGALWDMISLILQRIESLREDISLKEAAE